MSLAYPLHERPLSPRDVLHIPWTGPSHDRSRGHYHVVLTEKNESDKVILVSICSYFDKCDYSCILDHDTYDQLNHKSFVMYSKTRFYLHTHIIGKIALGEINHVKSANDDMLSSIYLGAFKSGFCAPVYKKSIRSYLEDVNYLGLPIKSGIEHC